MSSYYNITNYRAVAEWYNSAVGHVPHDKAVVGGYDMNGEQLYVGRALHNYEVIPGKIVVSHQCCYVPFNGKEISSQRYQVLTNPHNCQLIWVKASNGDIPTGALQGGKQSDGEVLYIGRAHYERSLTIGKVHVSHRVLYISFGGNEVPINHYEVLCVKEIPM